MSNLTNLVIQPVKADMSGFNQDIEKAHVKSYTKTIKSGKVVQVTEHDDSRTKKVPANKNKEEVKENDGGEVKKKEEEKVKDLKNMFIATISGKPTKTYRIHAKLPDGKIGITAWYSSEESIEELKKEIEASGAKVMKVESKEGA